MKSKTRSEAENNLYKAKNKAEKGLRRLMKDPTLEGKDENKVGRIPEKLDPID